MLNHKLANIRIIPMVIIGILIVLYVNRTFLFDINTIRNWVYQNTITGDRTAWKAQETRKMDVFRIYLYYLTAKGGAKCNNVAYFLKSILTTLGYQSFEYHFGKLNGFNHVVNLVKIKEGERYIYSIQDAYYNMTFLDKKGKSLDFFSLIKLINENKYEEIVIQPVYPGIRGHFTDIKELENGPIIGRYRTFNNNTYVITYYPSIKQNMREYYDMFIIPRLLTGDKGRGWSWDEIKYLLIKN